MPISFDGWVILVAIIGIIGAVFAFLIASNANRLTGVIAGTIGLWLAGYAVVTLIVIVFSSPAKPWTPQNEPLPYTVAAEQLGFVSGEEYPLVIGERVGGSEEGTNVSTTVRAGLFSARATTVLQSSSSPASAVSFSYTHEDKSYILELPTSRITFIQSDTQDPSVTIWLNDEATYDFGESVYPAYEHTACTWTFNNILVMCLWPSYDRDSGMSPVLTQHTRDVGLAPVIQASFDHATIVLSSETYKQLLGIIE